jgi:hypothetical protein
MDFPSAFLLRARMEKQNGLSVRLGCWEEGIVDECALVGCWCGGKWSEESIREEVWLEASRKSVIGL